MSSEREDLRAKNAPREYLLDDHAEVQRLMRECRGYLHTCHHKHGTDWEGRKFAIDALEKLADAGPAATAGSTGAMRETLEKCRNAIRSVYQEIDNPGMPACLAAAWELADIALAAPQAQENIGTYIDDNSDDGR